MSVDKILAHLNRPERMGSVARSLGHALPTISNSELNEWRQALATQTPQSPYESGFLDALRELTFAYQQETKE